MEIKTLIDERIPKPILKQLDKLIDVMCEYAWEKGVDHPLPFRLIRYKLKQEYIYRMYQRYGNLKEISLRSGQCDGWAAVYISKKRRYLKDKLKEHGGRSSKGSKSGDANTVVGSDGDSIGIGSGSISVSMDTEKDVSQDKA